MQRSLADWLEYQQRIHPADIALGLARVKIVADRLRLGRPAPVVITVGGTNGKGSTVAFIEAIGRASGYRVGAYTSPHLLRYNERVRIDGIDAGDAGLIAAFEHIEAARGDIPLTFFEFGTLAALQLFAAARLDLVVLEVGLGGRLDAVNMVDPDVAVVTTVALDHMEWLGNDRDAIGHEKAGIFRRGCPAIVGETDPPPSVLAAAAALDATVVQAGRDFRCLAPDATGFSFVDAEGCLRLPAPLLAAGCQPHNACTAIAALRSVAGRLPIVAPAWAAGVAAARIAGRMQRIERDGVELVLDVAHNPQAAQQLAQWLAANPTAGRTRAVFSALADKQPAQLVDALRAYVDSWWLAGLAASGPRGMSVEQLWQRVAHALGPAAQQQFDSVDAALADALAGACPGDRIVVFGSFHTVAAALQHLAQTAAHA